MCVCVVGMWGWYMPVVVLPIFLLLSPTVHHADAGGRFLSYPRTRSWQVWMLPRLRTPMR